MKKQRSPGPAAYNIKSTVCQDAPAYSFGTMKRPAPNFKGISPGPVYQLKASLGKNKDETFKAMPAFKFGTSERPDPAGNSRMREFPCEPHYSFFCVCLLRHAVSCALAAMLSEHALVRKRTPSEQTATEGARGKVCIYVLHIHFAAPSYPRCNPSFSFPFSSFRLQIELQDPGNMRSARRWGP